MAPKKRASTAAVAATASPSSQPAATDASALSSELWVEVLTKLPSPADLCAAVSTCSALRDAFVANRSAVWEALLASPRIEPYTSGPETYIGGLPGPPDVGEYGPQCKHESLYQKAMTLRAAWKSARCSQSLIEFPSFVRCVKVDWESDTLAVGLHDGTVRVCDLVGDYNFQVGQGFHASGQVLALDWCGEMLVSGSGEPSYNRQPCPGSTLRIVRLDRDRPSSSPVHELGARDGGHVDSINAIKIVELAGTRAVEISDVWSAADVRSCVACSASSDNMVIVWDLVAGKPLRQLAAHRAPVTALALVGARPAPPPAGAGWSMAEAPASMWSVASILSCAHDGEVREWAWRAGTCTRVVLAVVSPSPHASLSALSFHAATNSFAVGSQSGHVRLYRYNPRHEVEAERQLSCYPLTAWRGSGPESVPATRGPNRPGPNSEVASLQHDGDKLAYVTRAGVLDLLWLDPPTRQGWKRCPDSATATPQLAIPAAWDARRGFWAALRTPEERLSDPHAPLLRP